MESYLDATILLMLYFFMVASATEIILETFRGGLEKLGFKILKSERSLGDVLSEYSDLLPDNEKIKGKFEALKDVTGKVSNISNVTINNVNKIKEGLGENDFINGDLTIEINKITADVKSFLDKKERGRVFILRLISMLIATVICYLANFDVLFALVQFYPKLFGNGFGLYKVIMVHDNVTVQPIGFIGAHLGMIISGLAASGGSSYWHDKLDKLRNVKSITGSLRG